MSENNTNNPTTPTIIFHRSPTNAKESLKVLKEFIETYINPVLLPTIDYLSVDYEKTEELIKAT